MEIKNIDFAKFFDFEVAISQFNKASKIAITYLPEHVRPAIASVNDAAFNLARTTAAGIKDYAETMQSTSKEISAEFNKAVEKATKGFKTAA